MSSIGSRVSSPNNCTVADIPEDQTIESNVHLIEHPQYYFEDGNTIFQVEDVLYNVHRYFFVRDSAHFRTILHTGEDAGPCVLSDITCADFEEFLSILYPTDFRQPTKKTADQWSSILYLAEKWGFKSITLLAIDNLMVHATPIDKIVLGRRHGLTDWLPAAYEAVCTRVDPLTVEEGMKLGVEDTVRIAAARQLYGTGRSCLETKYLSGDLGQIFELVRPLDGTAEVEDGAETTLKILEEQIADAQNEHSAHLDTLVGCAWNCDSGKHYWSDRRTSYCRYCHSLETLEGKGKREAMEEKERQVNELKERLLAKPENRIGRQKRMASFK